MEGIDRTRHFFVRAGFVNNTHKQIAINQSLNGTIEEAVVNLKSRILLYTGAQWDNRYLFHAGFSQCAADKSDIVCRTASATGLSDDDRGAVKVIFAGKQSFHKLSDDKKRRITGIVIDIFETVIQFVFSGRKRNDVIAGSSKCRNDHVKMNRRHLWCEDGIVFTHFLRKDDAVVSCVFYLCLYAFSFPVFYSRDQRTDTDSGSPQVIYFVNLKDGTDFIGTSQDIIDLICCYRIQTTTEGI